jgi:hypothetical protein
MDDKIEFDGRPAPLDGCKCAVCQWVRENAVLARGPLRPSDPEWEQALRHAQAARR